MSTEAQRAQLEEVVSRLQRTADGGSVELKADVAELVALLALDPVRAKRACPHCGAEGMAAATRCGTCWSPLTPRPTP